jgi:hypothetical protein
MVIVTILCIGFLSCSKEKEEDDDSYDGYGYLEIVVNGTTYKKDDIFAAEAGFTGGFMLRMLPTVETPDVDINFHLQFDKNQKDFKNAKTGEYRIRASYDFDDSYVMRPFDLTVSAETSTGGYKSVTKGKHNITEIKLISTDKNSGTLTYIVKGNFSCSLKHSQNGKTLEMSGTYWTMLNIDPESKL